MGWSLPFERLPRPLPTRGRCVLPVPKGRKKASQNHRPKPGRQVALGLTFARPGKQHSFIVPPAAELVGGVGLEKDILYLAFGMTNE